MTRWRQLAAAWLLACPVLAPAHAPPVSIAALMAETDRQVQWGESQPEPALATLRALDQGPQAWPAWAGERRVLQLARGLLTASAGREVEAGAAVTALRRWQGDPLAAADAALVEATLADSRGDAELAVKASSAALQLYRAVCPAARGCDYRSSWRALLLQARHEGRRGRTALARESALEAIEVARDGADNARLAWALGLAADFAAAAGSDDAGHLAQAQRLALLDGSAAVQARVKVYESRILARRGDLAGARELAEAGAELARQGQLPRLEAVHLTNLSDNHVKSGNAPAALQAALRALPIARRFGDKRAELALRHNEVLARIGLGQARAVQPAIAVLLDDYRKSGAAGTEVVALREFADALAQAGDHKAALVLFHRERKLAAELSAANQAATLESLRQRFDREAEQRRMGQLSGENALMAAKLTNRAAMQKVWASGAAVLLLAMALVAVLYRRVREINHRLARNHAFLREQSHRDALTGLANRRCLHETAAAQAVDRVFTGALLLIDIDHFKHINDGHGHGMGDRVLVEVARRLAEVVRGDDLVVRWGGEEFLIYMPGVDGAQAQALAERTLLAIGSMPVLLGGGVELRVTVSVGYGAFPLPPGRLPLSLDRVINLADMALYTAKNQGRNRAVGIATARADDHEALRAIEAGFDQAWQDGRISLNRSVGPAEAAEAAEPAPSVTTEVLAPLSR